MNELVWAARELFAQGLAWGSSGNISMKHELGILISKSGTFFRKMEKEDFILASRGNIPKDASSETPLHLVLHQLVPENYVLMVHPPNAVAVSLLTGDLFEPRDEEGEYFFGSLPVVDLKGDDAREKASLIVDKMGSLNAVLLRGEGILVKGNDAHKVVAAAAAIEFSATVWLALRRVA